MPFGSPAIVDGLMVLPAMVYVPTEDELVAHFTAVAKATSLPVMLYNNPPAYKVNITSGVLNKLRAVSNIVAVKESAPDPRRFTDIINEFGDRYALMAGIRRTHAGRGRLGLRPDERVPD